MHPDGYLTMSHYQQWGSYIQEIEGSRNLHTLIRQHIHIWYSSTYNPFGQWKTRYENTRGSHWANNLFICSSHAPGIHRTKHKYFLCWSPTYTTLIMLLMHWRLTKRSQSNYFKENLTISYSHHLKDEIFFTTRTLFKLISMNKICIHKI